MQLRALMLAALCTIMLEASARAQERPTVAVFDFEIGTTDSLRITVSTERGTDSAEVEASAQTNLLSNKLITFLTQSNEVVVVEREKIRELMMERDFKLDDMSNPANAQALAKLLGADYMIFGALSMYDGAVEFSQLPYNAGTQKILRLVVGADTRLVHADTGQIVAAASLKAQNTTKERVRDTRGSDLPQDFQNEVITDLARQVVDHLLTSINPIKIARLTGDTAYLNRGHLKVGGRYSVVVLGEVIVDPDNPSDILGQEETPVAVVEVTSGQDRLSIGKVVEWVSSDHKVPAGAVCRPMRAESESP